ncbi:MAG: hypothetical protein ACRD96_01750 [Bryobacteraceae bacterium]
MIRRVVAVCLAAGFSLATLAPLAAAANPVAACCRSKSKCCCNKGKAPRLVSSDRCDQRCDFASPSGSATAFAVQASAAAGAPAASRGSSARVEPGFARLHSLAPLYQRPPPFPV